MKQNGSKFAQKKNELVLTSGEREAGRGNTGVRGGRVITGLYEIMCVKLLKTVNTIEFEESST